MICRSHLVIKDLSKVGKANLIKDVAASKIGSFNKAFGLTSWIGLGVGREILTPFFLIVLITATRPDGTLILTKKVSIEPFKVKKILKIVAFAICR